MESTRWRLTSLAVATVLVFGSPSPTQAWGIVNGALCHGYSWNRASTGTANSASVVTTKAAASDCVNPRVRVRNSLGQVSGWTYGGSANQAVVVTYTQSSSNPDFVGGGHGIFNPYTPIGSGSWLHADT